jgi:hypothetical protein
LRFVEQTTLADQQNVGSGASAGRNVFATPRSCLRRL